MTRKKDNKQKHPGGISNSFTKTLGLETSVALILSQLNQNLALVFLPKPKNWVAWTVVIVCYVQK